MQVPTDMEDSFQNDSMHESTNETPKTELPQTVNNKLKANISPTLDEDSVLLPYKPNLIINRISNKRHSIENTIEAPNNKKSRTEDG
jgi:hypothetical protein